MVEKVAFWGSSKDSLPALESIFKKFEISLVITSPDKPKGRGKKVLPSVVKEKAIELGINEILTPKKLNSEFKKEYFLKDIDIAVVVSYGKIIPESILNFPKYKTLNIHFSLLPRWRGASPVERAILNGDNEIGISIIRLVKKLDAGPVYSRISIPLDGNKFAYELRDELADLGAKEILRVLKDIDKIKPQEQNEREASYAPKITKEEGAFKWNFHALKIYRMVKAFTPWPSVFTFYKDKRLILTDVEISEEREGKIGEIFEISKRGIGVICGENTSIIIKQVKPEGKKNMSAYDFSNGARLKIGDFLV